MHIGGLLKKRAIALMLSALFIALPLRTALSGTVLPAENGEGEGFTLSPRVSDGVTISEVSDGSMSIAAHIEDDMLVFDETKDVCFTAEFAEGWSFSQTYSVFFPGDSRRYTEVTDQGSRLFGFHAVLGESVSLSAWGSAAVNAAASELPKLYIDAAVPFGEIDKTAWVEAEFTLTLGTKQFESGEYSGTGKVKGRGNSSWLDPKKPYSIKLDKKASLLDIPKTKKYAIVPSYWDYSLMRNYITYKAYQSLSGIGYVPKCEFVEVYMNGEYNGIYLLTERVDIESSKVNIEEADADHLSGGYLIEKDVNGKVDFQNDLWFNCPYWASQSRDYFVLKSPEPEDTALWAQMRSYLQNYVQLIHDSIINGQGEPYEHYVDTSSWVDFIIVQEIAKNIDGPMKTSCYMYKDRDDDHLYMTAPWDFDLAYGRVTWTNASEQHNDYDDCPPANTYDGFMIVNSSNPWMDKLYDTKPEFKRALMERYTEYRHTIIDELFALINEQAAYLSIAQEAECELWPKSFASGVKNLYKWLEGRISWLDEHWLIDEDEPLPGIDLDEALNIEGGDLHFETDPDSSAPFVGVMHGETALAEAAGAGSHSFRTTHEFAAADFVAFDYAFEGEGAVLKLFLDGEEALSLEAPADKDGGLSLGHIVITADGEHTVEWIFTCGEDGSALIDNVSIDFGCMMGDTDMNGKIDSTDALLALRYALQIVYDERGILLADVTGDSQVTTQDALIILRGSLGIS